MPPLAPLPSSLSRSLAASALALTVVGCSTTRTLESRAPLAAFDPVAADPASAPSPSEPVSSPGEFFAPPRAGQDEVATTSTGNDPLGLFAIHIGSRTFADDDLDAIFEDVGTFGAELSMREGRSGFGFEGGLFGSSEDPSFSSGGSFANFDLQLVELMLGGRYTVGAENFPLEGYIGGGLDVAFVSLEASASVPGFSGTAEDSEVALGGYVHGGAMLFVADRVGLGVDVRRTLGVEAFDIDFDSLIVSAVIGFRI